MKIFKFALSFLAASMMSTSQLVWAAADIKAKKEYNKYLKEEVMAQSVTFQSFYQKNRNYLDSQSQAWVESWLENYGSESLPKIETQTIVDKNGNETIKLILSKSGATGTLMLSSDDEDHFVINGQKFYYLEAMNLSAIINRLAEKDSSLKALAIEMNSNQMGKGSGSNFLTTEQVMKLAPIKKVEYFALYRKVLEASQTVLSKKTAAAQESENENIYAASGHPFFMSLLAQAASPVDGKACIVAGTVSQYMGGSCKSNPDDIFNKQCVKNGTGNVACNPLVYGFSSKGAPFCLNSSNQPNFTNTATQTCDANSPIKGEPGSKERNLSYRKILASYYAETGGKADISKCFNADHKADPNCKAIFEPQLEKFKALKDQAEAACAEIVLPDQDGACASLKARTLELAVFAGEQNPTGILPAPISILPESHKAIAQPSLPTSSGIDGGNGETVGGGGILPDKDKLDCLKDAKNKWDEEKKKCILPAPVPPVKEVKEKPVKEKKSCEKGNKSFRCNGWLAIPIIGALVGLALLLKGKKKRTPPTTPTVPQPPATLPPSEGGSGTAGGSSGGVR